eukprot:TRINITY_DN4741_c1_g2_i1.p1 TRINITY_DN4741_c1_g2~~TRINITY_DN4741_c1_g2_i1.p1  ORF type:complete len:735 (+),score=210.81 TRINITY_DN4741_c1_g2_i1:45-2207(+)
MFLTLVCAPFSLFLSLSFSLFSFVPHQASVTRDVVQKKLVYLYICHYAESNSDVSILSINTLLKDCRDENPMVRGLALRSICSLRVPNIVDYTLAPIAEGMKDPSPYVRRTAVMGTLKLFYISPTSIRTSDLEEKLYDMLRDKDPQVVTNAFSVLNEMTEDEGGIQLNKAIVHHVLNRLSEFNEWSQCYLLDVLVKYQPENEDEMYDIMNLLEERLKHSSSAVVLASTKIFLQLTQNEPEVHQQVYERLKAPLITLMSSGQMETNYATLHHINLLIHRAPFVFEDEYQHFFCKFNDPAFVKALKLEILTSLATDSNANVIVEELSEYVTDVSVNIARRSIRAIGEIAIKLPSKAPHITSELLSFLDLEMDYVGAETVLVMKDILRKYPQNFNSVLPHLAKCLSTIDEAEAKVAMVWMLGEYAEHLDEAPYMLEPFIDNFEEEQSPAVRMQVLTTAMKAFFKRPPECQAMLGRLLMTATNDISHSDVHDRAMLYYRLLAHDVDEAARVVNCFKQPIETFIENQASEVEDKLFDEFNSLSVVYQQPSDRFIVRQTLEETIKLRDAAHREQLEEQGDSDLDEEAALMQADVEEGDLLDMGGSGGGHAAPAAPALELNPSAVVEPGAFQQQWSQVTGEDAFSAALSKAHTELEGSLASLGVKCIASGTQGDQMKGYFYGVDAETGGVIMAEILVALSTRTVRATLKSDNPELLGPFKELISSVF